MRLWRKRGKERMVKGFIRFAKKLVGVYEPGYEYWVKLSDIHITPQFRWSRIKSAKYKWKWQFYHRNGFCENKIVLNKDFVLLDGEGTDCKVPVWFVE